MKKVLSFVLTLAFVFGCVPSVIAYESGDPCLLYGYDPDTRDDYETYGDEVFFRDKKELDSPLRPIFVILNLHASENIIRASESKGSVKDIINESYFPEIDIESINCDMCIEDTFASLKDNYLNNDYCDGRLHMKIYLKEWSKENFRSAIVALSPRADIDIDEIKYVSYNLSDVSVVMKCIAGWDGYSYGDLLIESKEHYEGGLYFDIYHDDEITLADASLMLKVIAGWEVEQ